MDESIPVSQAEAVNDANIRAAAGVLHLALCEIRASAMCGIWLTDQQPRQGFIARLFSRGQPPIPHHARRIYDLADTVHCLAESIERGDAAALSAELDYIGTHLGEPYSHIAAPDYVRPPVSSLMAQLSGR